MFARTRLTLSRSLSSMVVVGSLFCGGLSACSSTSESPGPGQGGSPGSSGAQSASGAPSAGNPSIAGQSSAGGGTSVGGTPSGGAPPSSAGQSAGGATAGALSGGAPSAGSAAGGAQGGLVGASGSSNAGAAGTPPAGGLGSAQHGGEGSSSERYEKADVTRNNLNYYFMANGWGPGFQSQSVTWKGTSFTVASMSGTQGGNYEPASYPTVFCGAYSDSKSKECGLPKLLSEITSLRTGWRWKANDNTGQYNAAWDIWIGDGPTVREHRAFLMVWLRDPPGQQPAGQPRTKGVSVANVQGTWDLWVGEVGRRPCISYTRVEGQDQAELEFDVLDFVKDVQARGISLPGTYVQSVAVGFEIWNGPISNLVSEDFYVEVR